MTTVAVVGAADARANASAPTAPGPGSRLVLLVAWSTSAARAWVGPLTAAGFTVVVEDRDGARAYRLARDERPWAVVVDCSTLPAHGRETASAVLGTKWGRALPLICANVAAADREKTERKAPGARAILPAPTSLEQVLALLTSLEASVPSAAAGAGARLAGSGAAV